MYEQVGVQDRPVTVRSTPRRPGWMGVLANIGRALLRNPKALAGTVLLGIFVFVAVFAPWIAPHRLDDTGFLPTAPPSHTNLLGTTSLGQDIFTQLIWGTRESLLLAVFAGLGATMLAVLVGVSAAYLGGWTDHTLGLITDIFLVIPQLPLMIIIAAYAKGGGFWVLVGVIVVTGWSFGARQLRPQALSLRNREFLEAARVRGERSFYIILVEILPTMTSLIVATFLGAAIYAVIAAAGLQFIGLGKSSDVSWGTMLYWAENQEALMTGAPWWEIAPGACIGLLAATFALLNYAFDEIGNPALRAKRRKRGRQPQ